MTGSFTGFISGFLHENRLYRFTEYGSGRLSGLVSTGTGIELVFINRSHILRVSAPSDKATPLASPVKGMMGGRIEESMTSVISLNLSEKDTGRVIFSGDGNNASIEVSGDIQTLCPH